MWRETEEKMKLEKLFFPSLILNFNILKATFRIVGESWDALSARLFWQILHSGFNDVADPLEDIGGVHFESNKLLWMSETW